MPGDPFLAVLPACAPRAYWCAEKILGMGPVRNPGVGIGEDRPLVVGTGHDGLQSWLGSVVVAGALVVHAPSAALSTARGFRTSWMHMMIIQIQKAK